MDDRLLVPATPGLLDGWVGPVVLLDPHERGANRLGAHLNRVGRASMFADWPADARDLATISDLYGEIDRVMLDLSRAECRDRVARVLADVLWPGERRARVPDSKYARQLSAMHFWVLPGLSDAEYARTQLALTRVAVDLDPNDDTRLPDGSRLVDALALAAVAREVLRAG